MALITTQRAARAVQKLPFCYVCCHDFAMNEVTSRDHVPPSACFALEDHNFPLQLPTHYQCNIKRNLRDEAIAQVIGLIHSGMPNPSINRLEIARGVLSLTKAPLEALINVDIHMEIRHWVRAFHAALYQQPLSLKVKFAIQPPFPSARMMENGPQIEPPRAQDFQFVKTIKLNRFTNSLDRIVCNNGKLRYECVWDQVHNGQWMCIFALDLYGWKSLGDENNFQARGCVGSYYVPNEPHPVLATRGTQLQVRVPNVDVLDPFGA